LEVRGDPTLTEEAVASWNAGQRKCRARGRHRWDPYTVWEHHTYYDVVERCSSCKIRRSADYDKRGRRQTKWKPDYRDSNYLLPKGAARISEDLKDELVLGDIRSRRIVEVTDEEES
jgi:hypothetical protein